MRDYTINRKTHQLSVRQAEILNFLHDWMDSEGKTLADLPRDWEVGRKLADVFGIHRQSGVQFVVQLRAAGCFGNPTDARVAEVSAARVRALRACLAVLGDDHEGLKRQIIALL